MNSERAIKIYKARLLWILGGPDRKRFYDVSGLPKNRLPDLRHRYMTEEQSDKCLALFRKVEHGFMERKKAR